ncbi:MAG: hypothetical protein DWQ10_05495, partial [Calditrichaeota bacterium]
RRRVAELGSFDAAIRSNLKTQMPEENYTAKLTWGDTDAAFETAAYQLALNQISEVVSTSRGFMVIQLINVSADAIQTEAELQKKRSGILKVIRTRKADVQSSKFLHDYLKELDFVIKGQTFAVMVRLLEERVEFKNETALAEQKMSPEDNQPVDFSESDLIALRNKPLITFSSGQITFGEIVEKLQQRNVPLDNRSPEFMRNSLRKEIFNIARDEILIREANERKLDERPGVKNDLRLWSDYLSYRLLADKLKLKEVTTNDVHFGNRLRTLKDKYEIKIDTTKLGKINVTTIPFLAVRPGQSNQLVVPYWPMYF